MKRMCMSGESGFVSICVVNAATWYYFCRRGRPGWHFHMNGSDIWTFICVKHWNNDQNPVKMEVRQPLTAVWSNFRGNSTDSWISCTLWESKRHLPGEKCQLWRQWGFPPPVQPRQLHHPHSVQRWSMETRWVKQCNECVYVLLPQWCGRARLNHMIVCISWPLVWNLPWTGSAGHLLCNFTSATRTLLWD